MDDHTGVVQLELDHASLETFLLRQVLSELGSRLAVDGKLERVVLDYHMDHQTE